MSRKIYRRINFQQHRYFMLYRIENDVVYVDDIFHELQDYSHILDDDRKKNAELFEEAFYEKKNLDPQMQDTSWNPQPVRQPGRW